MRLEEYFNAGGSFVGHSDASMTQRIWDAATVAARDECAAIVLKNAHMFYTPQACQMLADEVRSND